MFDPGGSLGHLRASPFLGSWRALLCGDVMQVGGAGDDLQRFWRFDDSTSTCGKVVPVNYLRRTCSGQFAGSSQLGRL